jgi:hypothetical protein
MFIHWIFELWIIFSWTGFYVPVREYLGTFLFSYGHGREHGRESMDVNVSMDMNMDMSLDMDVIHQTNVKCECETRNLMCKRDPQDDCEIWTTNYEFTEILNYELFFHELVFMFQLENTEKSLSTRPRAQDEHRMLIYLFRLKGQTKVEGWR